MRKAYKCGMWKYNFCCVKLHTDDDEIYSKENRKETLPAKKFVIKLQALFDLKWHQEVAFVLFVWSFDNVL